LLALVGCGQREEARKRPDPGAPILVEVKTKTMDTADPWATDSKPAVTSVAATACPTVKAPYFFRIEKDGKTSYLLGTRHIGVAWRKMPEVVHAALRDAKLVVFETVDDDGSDDKPGPHKSAREELGPKLWDRYRAIAGDALADSVDSPAEALLTLMVRYEDQFSSLEREIGAEAEKLHKPTRGLETNAFQQKLLDRYLDGRALRAYIEHLDGLDELKQDTIDDLEEYCAGTDETPGMDPKERADMIDSGYTEAEITTMDKDMLFDRNRSWIPRLAPILAEGNAFIAVGADHTRGDQGVPALLVAKGYNVVRVTPVVK
jgi:uncharacterized protein